MPTNQVTPAEALAHQQAGQFQRPEEVRRQVGQDAACDAETLHLLGLNAYQQGRDDLAIEYIRHAIALDATQPHFHNNLGEICRRQGRLSEAILCYQRLLQLRPDSAEAHNDLGAVWYAQGHSENAIACFRRAIDLKPDYAEAHSNLGAVWYHQGKLDEAVACLRRAVELDPCHVEAYKNLATIWHTRARLDEARASYQRALELRPDCAETWVSLGAVWYYQGNLDQAAACFRRAIELKPDYAEAHSNLSNALRDQGRTDEAIACCQLALQLKPDLAEGHYSLAGAWCARGEPDEAIACCRQAMELKPDSTAAHSTILTMLQYRDGVTLAELRRTHGEYEARHAAPLRAAWRPHDNPRDPERTLRLGLISTDFGRHPVGYFLIGVLEHLDPRQAETVCYSNRLVADDMTASLEAASTMWRNTAGMTDECLAEQIRADGIDVLFDLSGHTAGNRLLVFARKPAPIQATWIGYVGTTGLAGMDYILADQYEIPPEAEPYYAERVLRLPHGYVCYAPPSYAPPVAPLPALAAGHVTFGCFNHPAKITPRVVACWARILSRLPHARLILKYRGLGDPGTQSRLGKLFVEQGVAPYRVEVLGASPHDELLAHYNRVDVALDPFPYSGGLTTCEALWMGVPVVTCPGDTFASRHSLTHLANVGLTETIAANLDEYVELAVALAQDLPRLAALRAGLRQRMAQSPLCDAKQFAADLMAVLRRAWREWAEAGR